MKTSSWVYLCVGSLLLSTGCEKEAACGAAEPTILPLQVLAPRLGQATSGLPKSNQTFVANSAAELAAILPAAYVPTPALDFTRYTLLGGLATRRGGVAAWKHQVVQDCRGTIIYSAQVVDGNIQMPSTLFYGVLVDKLPHNATIKFDVDDSG